MIESMSNGAARYMINDREGLMQALSCEDHHVRIYAVKTLETLADRRSIGLLLDALKDEHFDVRETAYLALRKIGHKALPSIITALKDDNFYVRMYAALAITDYIIENPEMKYSDAVVDALTLALLDKSIYVRRSAYDALKVIEYNKILKSLISSLKDPDHNIRLEAAIALGRIADKKSVKPLIKSLNTNDPNMKKCISTALGRIKDRKATTVLIGLLNDQDGSVRKEAVKALGAIADEKAVSGIDTGVKGYGAVGQG